jgi:hypothetical protein
MIKLAYESDDNRLDFWVDENGNLNINDVKIPHNESVRILTEMLSDLHDYEISESNLWDKFWGK